MVVWRLYLASGAILGLVIATMRLVGTFAFPPARQLACGACEKILGVWVVPSEVVLGFVMPIVLATAGGLLAAVIQTGWGFGLRVLTRAGLLRPAPRHTTAGVPARRDT